jgi:type IX secretion system PorP/SprF family membrane protein
MFFDLKFLNTLMSKKLILIIIFINALFIAKAQINNIHNFYTQNLYYFSPAHTGDKDQLAAFIDIRNQLTAIEFAGQTAVFGVHSPVTSTMNIGILIKTERLGLFETLSGRIDYSYRTKIAADHSLAFGININALQRNICYDLVKVADISVYDPTLNPDYFRKNIFFYGAAVNYTGPHLEFDFSVPVLYKSDNIFYTNYWSFFAYNVFSKSKIWQIKPSVSAMLNAVKTTNDADVSNNILLSGYNINLMVNYNNIFWVQPTYKKNGSIVVSAGVNLKKLGIAYAYETNSGALAALGGPSHEIMLTYGFFKSKNQNIDTIIYNEEYYRKLQHKIGDKTYEEYISSNNYGFYNNIIELSDSMHREEIRKIELSKDTIQKDTLNSDDIAQIEKARLDSLEQIRRDSIAQAERDSARMHHLRNVSESEMKILEKGVHFELGSAMLKSESRTYLNKVADLLKNNPNIKVLISGHTCDIGSESANEMYSRDRAEAVKYFLISKGVSSDQISTDLKLDAEPIVPNTSEANRQQNRRVSFSIIKE